MAATMGTTDAIAVLFAIYLIAAGAGVILNRSMVGDIFSGIRGSATISYLCGLIAFMIGTAIVAVHNRWDGVLPGLVSLVGWAALAEGVLLLAIPKTYLDIFAPLAANAKLHALLGWFSVALGVVLLAAVFVI